MITAFIMEQMGLYQIKILLYTKGNNQCEEKTFEMGKLFASYSSDKGLKYI